MTHIKHMIKRYGHILSQPEPLAFNIQAMTMRTELLFGGGGGQLVILHILAVKISHYSLKKEERERERERGNTEIPNGK
jgi:hypothetical protein